MRKQWAGVIGSIALLVVAGLLIVLVRHHEQSPIPTKISQAVTLKLYYPKNLPAGYKIDRNTFSLQASVVSYHATDSHGYNIVFTVQARPKNFDFTAFYKEGLQNSTQFTTPLGEAATGTVQGSPFGDLVGDNSWLLLSTNSPTLTANDFAQILRGLKQY